MRTKQPRHSEILLRKAEEITFFHDGEDAFAIIQANNHKEIWPIKSQGFRRWLTSQFFDQMGYPPNANALNDASRLLEARAYYRSPERKAHVRVAQHDGLIYMDLADDKWQAIRIGPYGWGAASSKPHFIRHKGMLSLPFPEKGNIEELREFLNIEDDETWQLIVAWLLQALRPIGPYPLLVFYGEQGSAKSTVSKMLRSLIDPSIAPFRSKPRSERDLVITANNSWVLVFDNLSGIKDWLSDALCRISTGGGFSTRQLFTDRDEVIFKHQRPIILNGIDEMVARHDLADRSVFLTLPPIPDHKRISEKELFDRFEMARPRILGSLLDAVSVAMKNVNTVSFETLPRMADFAQWVQAAEPALPWREGGFIKAYTRNRREIYEKALDADMVATVLRSWMADTSTDEWEGTASQLQGELELSLDEKDLRKQEWPKTPHHLSGAIRRCASFLRRVGLEVEFTRGSGSRIISIKRIDPKKSVRSVQSSYPQGDEALRGDADDADDAGKRNFSLSICPFCKGSEFWRLKGGDNWVCQKCHPAQLSQERIERIEAEVLQLEPG